MLDLVFMRRQRNIAVPLTEKVTFRGNKTRNKEDSNESHLKTLEFACTVDYLLYPNFLIRVSSVINLIISDKSFKLGKNPTLDLTNKQTT